jgi:DNA-binding beta-propeller fold protein YncE
VARKSGATVVAACVAVLGAGGGYLLLSKSNQARPPHASHGTTGQVTSPRVITPPTCTTQVAAAGTLQNVPSHMVSVGRVPFDVVLAPGHFGFVSNGAGITVLNTARPVPSVLHTVALTSAQGEALTQDGKYLLVATGNGMTVFRSSTLEAGGSAPLGSLTVPGGNHAVEVTVTGDDRFAFVSIQQSNEVAVFNLQRALSAGFGPADVVGTIPVPKDPVGVTLSKDGKYLYVASGLARPAVQSGAGVLSVVSVQKAETSPKSSVLKNINAGCGPDRMAVSPDGRYLWLTAGGGNALLAYSTASLITDPTHALVAKVALGELPLGMIFVNHGTAIVVADSNRDKIASAAPNLAVVGVKQALAGQHGALVGLITSGTTPRQFALEPNGHTLLVTNTESGQLQAVNITHLP